MSYQVLARKWRPRVFGELVGQEHVVRALTNALDNDRLHHAYLFTGTRGVGKTTLARILAKSLNCERGVSASPCGVCSACREIEEGRFADLLEVDAASRTKVEQTRELLENVPYAPVRGRYKVYLIDEVHMFSASSFNALLKTLEEPPPHVKFLLATTDPQKVPVTVLSRCLQFNLKRLPLDQIRGQLEAVLGRENVAYEIEALTRLARAADGSMRDALSLLDQAISFGAGEVREADVISMLGSTAADRIRELVDCLADRDAEALLSHAGSMAEQSADFAAALQEMLLVLHRIALLQVAPEAANDPEGEMAALRRLAGKLLPEDVQLYYQIGLIGQRDLPLAPDPRSGFEMVLLRMLAFRPSSAKAPAAPVDPAPQRSASGAREKLPSDPAAGAEPQSLPANTKLNAASWHHLVERLELGGIASQLASHCEFLSWDGTVLCLRLDPASQHMRVARAEERLHEALRRQLGREAGLRISVESPQSETPARRRARERADRQREAEETLREDPLVRALEKDFGAQVIPDSVEPIEK